MEDQIAENTHKLTTLSRRVDFPNSELTVRGKTIGNAYTFESGDIDRIYHSSIRKEVENRQSTTSTLAILSNTHLSSIKIRG